MEMSNFPTLTKEINGIFCYLYKIPLVYTGNEGTSKLYKITALKGDDEKELPLDYEMERTFESGDILRYATYNYNLEIKSYYQ